MAELKNIVDLEIKIRVNLEISETEARALSALIGYGIDPFKKVFYEKLGETYMKPHEKGLESLFSSIQEQVVPTLSKIDKIKNGFAGVLKDTKSNVKVV